MAINTVRLAEKSRHVGEIGVVAVIEMVEDLIANDSVVEPVSTRQFGGTALLNVHLGIIGEAISGDLRHARVELNAMQAANPTV